MQMYNKINCKQTIWYKNNYFFNNDCNYKIYYYICDMKTKTIIEFDSSELLELKEYAESEGLKTDRQSLLNLSVKLSKKYLSKCILKSLKHF